MNTTATITTKAAAKSKGTKLLGRHCLTLAQWRRCWPESFGVLPAVALILALGSSVAHAQAAASQANSIQFVDVAAAAGIKFVHYRGNDGIPSTERSLLPGFVSPISTVTAIRTFT